MRRSPYQPLAPSTTYRSWLCRLDLLNEIHNRREQPDSGNLKAGATSGVVLPEFSRPSFPNRAPEKRARGQPAVTTKAAPEIFLHHSSSILTPIHGAATKGQRLQGQFPQQALPGIRKCVVKVHVGIAMRRMNSILSPNLGLAAQSR